MTSRGNQSVSPPAQIPQQRHVNAISSSTPPPQQYYPGQSSALSQGAYEYLPQTQGQPFIPYQAYGSALSDARGQPGNNSRGGPPQQNVQQGGNFYQQPGPNIRPQQTQQSHTYFISAQPQGNIRPPRPTHQSTSQMVFIPQSYTPRNNLITIPANMYQGARVPVFQPYVPGTSYPTNIVYYQNGAPGWQGQGMAPTTAATIRPQVREKRVLSIQDPDTGRDITEELLNSRSHSTSAEDHPEDVTSINQNDKEICQTFTRLVADRLKSPDDSNTSGTSSEPHGTVSSAPASITGSVSASQQYQQPPPQQQVQQPPSIAPATMMRPPPSVPHHIIPAHPGMIQQTPATTAPSHDMQHQLLNVNLSIPPPQFPLRQPTPTMYSSVQQQQHHVPRHPQQQSMRPQMPPVVAPPPQQAHIQPQPPQSANNLPSGTTIESTPHSIKVETSVPDKQTPQVEATSHNNIPAKPAGPPASTPASAAKPSSPVEEVLTAPLQTVEVLVKPAALPSSVKTVVASEEVNIDKIEDTVKVEAPHGGGSQVVKDGRKGKKGKKDFICKEIGGTDMDAFIDSPQKTNSNLLKTSVGSDNASPLQDRGESVSKLSAQASAKNVQKRDPKNPWKIQPVAVTPVKKDAQNPWALREPQPAKTDLPVSTTSAQESSGVKESSNPWKILPVHTVETRVSNLLKDSNIMKTVCGVSKSLQDGKNKRNIISIISNPFGDSNIPSTILDADSVTSLTSPSTAHHKSSKQLKPTLVNPVQGAECEILVTQKVNRTSQSTHNAKYKSSPVSAQIPQDGNKPMPKTSVVQLPCTCTFEIAKLSQNQDDTIISTESGPFQKTLLMPNSTLPELSKHETLSNTNSLKAQNLNITAIEANLNNCQDSNKREVSTVESPKYLASIVNLTWAKKSRCSSDIPPSLHLNTAFNLESGVCTKIIYDSSHNRTRNNTPTVKRAGRVNITQDEKYEKYTVHRKLLLSAIKEQDEARSQVLPISEVTLDKPCNKTVSEVEVDGANSGAGESNMTRTNNALEVTSESNSIQSGPQSSSGHSLSNDIEGKQETVTIKDSPSTDQNLPNHAPVPVTAGVSLDCGYSRDDSPNPQNNQEQQKPAMTSAQVESKHKQKKKKKKGRKTPPNQKVKLCSSSNDNSERQNEVVEVVEKPPLPQPIRKASMDKTAVHDLKTPPTSIPDTQEAHKLITKESGPLPQQPTPTVHTNPAQQPDVKVNKTVTPPPQKESKTVAEVNPITDTAVSTHINKNEYQQTKHSEKNVEVHLSLEQSVSSKPLENGIPDNEPVTNDLADDSSAIDREVINDEIELPLDPVSEHGDEDIKKVQLHGINNEVSPTSPLADKVLVKVKKEKEKLQYDRAYLMELRECASSQAKPDGLPNLEIILDRPVTTASRGSSVAPLDFTPAFFQPSGNQRHAPQISKTNSRNRPRSDAQIPQRVIKSVSLQDSVKPLHQSEKPWKPKQASTGDIAETRKSLESGVLFIMNRLTPTNFERLAGEMKKLNIKAYEDLQELVNIFFDKVTLETKFVEAYANLCKVMSGLKVVPPANSTIKENQATFRVVMLTKCQQEFEADKTVVFEDPEEKRKKMEAEMPAAPEKHAQIENTLYQMKLRRLKFYGNIRFIGELFKLGMLTENIMHDCIYRLLKARDDDSLVSLCNLITTVGQALDTDKAKTRMDQYFTQMAKIAEERKSRIKFTLKDAIDMRSNNWVPRKEQTGPKKIDEVHKDFQEEQATKQFLQSQPLPPRSDAQQPNSRRGSKQRQDENKMLTDDGWNTVGSKSLRIDASKMKLSKSVVDENIQLGPGGGMKQFSMWSRGSFGGIQPSQDNDRNSAPNNRFSALRGEEDHRNYQRSPSRGDGASRSMRQQTTSGHGRGKILARSSQEGERRDALASARSIVGGRSQNSSRDNSWNREDRRQFIGPRGSRESENQMTRSDIILRPSADSLMPPPAVSPVPVASTSAGVDDGAVLKKVKPLTEVEMEHKAKTILEEYLSVMDLEEAKLCLRELRGQEHLPLFVTASFNEVLERSAKERDLTGLFFHEVVKSGQIPIDTYLKGLAEVLQFAEDMVIDIPMMWTYLAQIIVPMLIRGSLLWSSLPSAFKPFLGGKCSAKLIAEILLLAKEKTSEAEVALMWQSNNLTWTTFLEADEVDRLLKDKKLEFTVGQVAASTSRVSGYSQVDLQKVADDIEKIVRESGTSNDIFAYIDARFPVGTQDKHFLRALVTGLINVSISAHTMKFNEDVIKTHKSVLQRFIKSNPELELQALYAIQALMHKLEHPSGVAATIFDLLYYEDIISEETFKQWEKSTDPQEAEGKGACSMQLTQFFTWLRENEEPETS